MSNQDERNSRKWNFSLRYLLMLTALIALSTAVFIAYRKNQTLKQSRDVLLSLSSRLDIAGTDELTHVEFPRVASDFQSWEVNVPDGPPLELRFGVGEISEVGIPSKVDCVPLPAGRHRVTLHAVVSAGRGNRFVVYVDGRQVLEKTPGPEWMPGAWASSGGLFWTQTAKAGEQAPRQLVSKRFTPRAVFGDQLFNGWDNSLVTTPGYRLWIDKPDRIYEPASPFFGFDNHARFRGVGLRDGLRYKMTTNAPYEFTFTRPKSRVRDPVLRIIPEFIVDGQSILSSQTSAFSAWQLRNTPDGKEPLHWTEDRQKTAYNAFLNSTFKSDKSIKPVIELKWDADRPNDVALRLAETSANERITRLRLRIAGGAKHLWRNIDVGTQQLDSRKGFNNKTSDSGKKISIEPEGDVAADIQINWQTDHSLPLQIVQRPRRGKTSSYSGLSLYDGLPLKFAAQIPNSLDPSISVTRTEQHPTNPGKSFPGGAVFDEIQIEVNAKQADWIWLQATDRKNDGADRPRSP